MDDYIKEMLVVGIICTGIVGVGGSFTSSSLVESVQSSDAVSSGLAFVHDVVPYATPIEAIIPERLRLRKTTTQERFVDNYRNPFGRPNLRGAIVPRYNHMESRHYARKRDRVSNVRNTI